MPNFMSPRSIVRNGNSSPNIRVEENFQAITILTLASKLENYEIWDSKSCMTNLVRFIEYDVESLVIFSSHWRERDYNVFFNSGKLMAT